MNTRARVLTALNHQQPDKTPYQLWMNQGMRDKMIQFTGDPDFESKLGNCFVDVGDYQRNYRERARGLWEDQFSVLWDRRVDQDIGTVCNCMVTPETIEDYRFPDARACLETTLAGGKIRWTPDRFVILQLGFSFFERAWTLAGMETVLSAMAGDESFIRRLFDEILEFNLRWIEHATRLEIDAVLFGDDWGDQRGLMMGPTKWRKFIKPGFEQMCQAVKNRGKFVFLHSCGKVDEIFPELIECGVDVFNPFQPEVMDVFLMKKKYGGSLSFFGGISVQRTLPFGTVADVQREVKSLLDKIGEDGGYIAAPSHSIPRDAKAENVAAMLRILQDQ